MINQVDSYVNATAIPEASNLQNPAIAYMKPSIVSTSISNVYLKSTLLEVESELDNQIDKVVQGIGYRYQLDFIQNGTRGLNLDFTRRLLPSLKSLRRVLLGQRPIIDPTNLKAQKLGFRVKNYMESVSLLYNKSVVADINSAAEAYQSARNCYGPIENTFTYGDFDVNYEVPVQWFNLNSDRLRESQDTLKSILEDSGNFAGFWWNYDYASFFPTSQYGSRGRFMAVFDCLLPNSTPNSVAGIDTSANMVEYCMKTNNPMYKPVNVDVFLEHDMFIHVDPGKATAVSF
jgi:hypothetical protein